MVMNPDTVLDVIDRENACCAVCGLPVAGRGHVHHRKPRRMGGSRNLDRMSNLVYLHTDCHLKHVEQQRARAYENGWLVADGQEPSEMPMRYMLDRLVLLDDNGTISVWNEQNTPTTPKE